MRQIADVNVAPLHNGEGCMERGKKGCLRCPGRMGSVIYEGRLRVFGLGFG